MTEKELFIVEGESAASTVRQAMAKVSQEVLAVKGKLINANKASEARVMNNLICSHIVDVLECGWNKQCDPGHLAFSRVIILTDPDADGAHARALLINFFAIYLEPLIKSGLVFVVIPPLYRLTNIKGAPVHYAWSKQEYEGLRNTHPALTQTTRFKGVAQLTLAECAELLLQSKSKYRVRLTPNDQQQEGTA